MNEILDSSTRDLTLVDLFGANSENFSPGAAAAMLASPALLPLHAAMLGDLSYFPWREFVTGLGISGLELLRTRLLDICVFGLQKSQQILEYRDRTKHPPGQVATVPLFERSFKTQQRPYLEILYRQVPYKIFFEVEVTLTMKQVVLEIRDGRITAVQSGFLEGSGSISYEGNTLLRKDKFATVKLPGILKLKDGIPI